MNSNQEDKLSMYFAVELTGDRHAAVIEGLPAFATNYAALETQVDAIRALADEQVTGNRGHDGKQGSVNIS